jgi:transcriptional regulator with XRE-family HTH domain
MLAAMRSFRSHPSDIGRARARQLAAWYGNELRIARVSAGLTQAQLARVAEVTQQEVSRAESGRLAVSLEIRCRLAAACGHELRWRLHPVATVSLRDSGQLKLAETILRAAHASWVPELEAPVAPGDPRAADILFRRTDELAEIEIERALVDFQAQLRAAQLKRLAIAERDSRSVRLVIAVPDSDTSRARLRTHADLIRRTLPVPTRRIWASLRSGEAIGGDGLLFVRPTRG